MLALELCHDNFLFCICIGGVFFSFAASWSNIVLVFIVLVFCIFMIFFMYFGLCMVLDFALARMPAFERCGGVSPIT